jgi:hypothetical protein
LVVGQVLVAHLLSEPALVLGQLLESAVGGWVLSPLEAIVSGFAEPSGPTISAALLREPAVGPSLGGPSRESVVMPLPVLLAALVPWAVLLASVLLAVLVP